MGRTRLKLNGRRGLTPIQNLKSSKIEKECHIGMKPQERGGKRWADLPFEQPRQWTSFGRAAHQQQDPARLQQVRHP